MGNTTVTLFCYARDYTENDYKEFIRHDSSGCPPEILQVFLETHKAFAKSRPINSTQLGFPIRSSDPESTYYCLCRCETIQPTSDRPYARLIGVATEVESLRSGKVDVADLSDAVDRYGWDKIESLKRPAIDLPVSHGRLVIYNNLRQTYAEHFKQSREADVPIGVNLTSIFNTLVYSLRDAGNNAFDISIAAQLPRKTRLPIEVSFAAYEASNSNHQAVASIQQQPSNVNVNDHLDRIATSISGSQGIDRLWQIRLWNLCQDLHESAELCLAAAKRRDSKEFKRLSGEVDARYNRILTQFNKLIMLSSAYAREVGALRQKLGSWSEMFQQETHMPKTAPRDRTRIRMPRWGRANEWMFGAIVLLMLAGIVFYLWRSANPAPSLTNSSKTTASSSGSGDTSGQSTGDKSKSNKGKDSKKPAGKSKTKPAEVKSNHEAKSDDQSDQN